jgi:hypothetical protein
MAFRRPFLDIPFADEDRRNVQIERCVGASCASTLTVSDDT